MRIPDSVNVLFVNAMYCLRPCFNKNAQYLKKVLQEAINFRLKGIADTVFELHVTEC